MITDLTPYRQYLEGFDLTDEETLDFVNSMLGIALGLVDDHFKETQNQAKIDEISKTVWGNYKKRYHPKRNRT